jgi:hypothetical protein
MRRYDEEANLTSRNIPSVLTIKGGSIQFHKNMISWLYVMANTYNTIRWFPHPISVHVLSKTPHTISHDEQFLTSKLHLLPPHRASCFPGQSIGFKVREKRGRAQAKAGRVSDYNDRGPESWMAGSLKGWFSTGPRDLHLPASCSTPEAVQKAGADLCVARGCIVCWGATDGSRGY